MPLNEINVTLACTRPATYMYISLPSTKMDILVGTFWCPIDGRTMS